MLTESWEEWVLTAVVGAFVLAGAAVFASLADRRRSRALGAWAKKAGYACEPGPIPDPAFPLLPRAEVTEATTHHRLTAPGRPGIREGRFTVLGASRRPGTIVVCGAELPGEGGEFAVRPRAVEPWFAWSDGLNPVDLGDRRIGGRFLIRAPGVTEACSSLPRAAIDVLLANPDLAVEATGGRLLVWRLGKLTPRRASRLARFATAFAAAQRSESWPAPRTEGP